MKTRLLVFLACTALLIGVATAYTLHALHREQAKATGPAPQGGTVRLAPGGPARLLYRATTPGPGLGHLAEAPLAGGTPGLPDTMACERSFTAAGRLLCLSGGSGLVLRQQAEVLDADRHVLRKVDISGLPSRARLSADGRLAAWTTFVYGDSYTSVGFSTRTSILDLRSGDYLPSLEEFTTYKDGKVFAPADRNFWGVSFAADDNTFYATVSSASGGGTYLARGDLAARTLTVLHGNVECPSLSPDGTRIAYKKRVSDDQSKPWRLYVLDLATLHETPLAETRSVDDQALWVDDRTVAYALPAAAGGGSTDIWAQPADGSGNPRLLVAGGGSPSVLR